MPGLPVHHQLREFTQTHVHRVGDAVQPSPPFVTPFSCPQSFQWVVLHIRWPKYWCFSLSISPSNEYSGLISFRMDGFDLFAVQETLKSLLQHPTVLWHSAFFIIPLSHPFMTTGKTIVPRPAQARVAPAQGENGASPLRKIRERQRWGWEDQTKMADAFLYCAAVYIG